MRPEHAFEYGKAVGHVEAYTRALFVLEKVTGSDLTVEQQNAMKELRIELNKAATRKRSFDRRSGVQ